MNKLLILFLISFDCTILYNNALGQEQKTDSIQRRILTANMDGAFNKAIGNQSRLYNGFSYELYDKTSSVGNAYFRDTTSLVNGNVNYDGIFYKNVPLIYDINHDLLVSHLYNGDVLYRLLSEDVAYFDLLGHHFVRINPANASKLVPVGFYDELYNGKLRLLAKRTKGTQKGTRGFGVATITYFQENNYYIKKGGVYYDVNGRGNFFGVLKDKKKELKKYLKDNNISFGDNREQAMASLAAYYDKLTN